MHLLWLNSSVSVIMSLKLRYVFFLKINVLCYKYCGNMLHYVFLLLFFFCFFSNVVQVSVYAVPDKKEQVQYALDTACKLLEFYNSFFKNEYPLSKLGETPSLKETLHTGIICFLEQLDIHANVVL